MVVVVLIVAAVVSMATPVGSAVRDSLMCAYQTIVSTQHGDASCESGEVDASDDDTGDDEVDEDDDAGDDEGDDKDDLPPYDPDDCTSDDSCEDVWEGSLEPHEPEGDIEEVGFLECNVNVLGWYPNGYVRFSWEVRSLGGSGGASPSVCVDGSGTVNIDQEGVERFDAGENSGWFVYKGADGYEYKHYFEKGETSYFDPSSTIYEVHID
ncbi:hypothetical protein [Promicromonospora sp. AC04]|uniref:hypothetical protein n=1 Tax=Promicromonospora sp. AC04 TaxID=2135723 RepID=UPI0018EE5F2F|nr:hypothetical protein [Promicromonospora sp. AC04]